MVELIRLSVQAVRQASPLPGHLLVSSLAVPATLVALLMLFPGRSETDVFLAAFLIGSLIRCSSYISRRTPPTLPSAIAAGFVAVIVLAAMQFQDPIWLQRIPTITSALFVILYGMDLIGSDFSLTRRYFPDAGWVEIYPRLARIRTVLWIGQAIMNETAIALLTPLEWLALVSFWPLAMHYLWSASADVAYWTRPGAPDRDEV